MKKYVCSICGYVYDEAAGIPSAGIAPGTLWEALPDDWVCPLCHASKDNFKEQKTEPAKPAPASDAVNPPAETNETLRELSMGELSALFSNLARGCEKQYLSEEASLFTELADYFKNKTPSQEQTDPGTLLELLKKDLAEGYPAANAAAAAHADRGAMRALVWGEKVSRMLNSLLERYQSEGDTFLRGTNIYVCDACGFIYVGETPPELCPVCKVPSWKFAKVERR